MIDTISIKWDLLGAKLACLSDEEQAAFFKGFATELSHYESRYKAEMQLMFVNNKLDNETKKILEDLLPALWFEEKKL